MRLVSIVIIFTYLISVKSTRACTAFCLQDGSGQYVAKNLDWSIENGYVFLNESNVIKSILLTKLFDKNEFKWTSKYRSLTFNQFGKEFPLGGMNEHGLVVEELNAVPVKLRLNDSMQYFNEFQLSQYLLDNCRSVEEAVEQLSSFQYKPIIQSLHYLVTDKTGNVLIVEYNGESFDFYNANETNVPVLSNNNYEESLRYLSKFKGFGGDVEVKNRAGSNERFVSVAKGLKQYKNENPVEYCFEQLNLVQQADTKWSIVYDIKNLLVHFKFHSCKKAIIFDFQAILSQPTLCSLGCDITKCNQHFSIITRNMNTTLLHDVFILLSKENGKEVDYNLLYKMLMAGNQHLSRSNGQKAILYQPLSESLNLASISNNAANSIYQIFKNSQAFDWTDRKNNCEDRAAAICLILDEWGIDNCKVWIYSGKRLKDDGFKGTLNQWNYHVSACVFTANQTGKDTMVIDPIVSPSIIPVYQWAEKVSKKPTNIYFITSNKKYKQKKISLNPEWKFTKHNKEKIIEGLTRYSSGSLLHRIRTKKYLKTRYLKAKNEFYKLYNSNIDDYKE